MNTRDKEILQIAVPSIVSNITVPLLGLIDVAIVGHMGSASYIGAVAVGSMIFNLVYWLFGFLRMGTSGLTAQAYGRQDQEEAASILRRSLKVALLSALALIVLQVPLRWLMFWIIGPTPDVSPLATLYFRIVIWGAPAMLGLYSLTGWFIGMQNTRIPMFISIMQNVVNILVSLLLVYGFGMKIEGVAIGTVVAQYAGLVLAIISRPSPIPLPIGRGVNSAEGNYSPPSREGRGRGSSINIDIFLRTLCLVAVNLYFTAAGARQGAVILSVNTVILQLYLLFSYFMDGFAYAGEALGGRFYGARDAKAFSETLHHLFYWAAGVTAVYTVVYVIGGMWIVSLLTDEQPVVNAARDYIFWAWLIPVAGAAAFIWDGVFIGLTATRGMLVSSAVSALLFFAIFTLGDRCWVMGDGGYSPPVHVNVDVNVNPHHSPLTNHFLWLAQIVYLAMRGILQTAWYLQMERRQQILHSSLFTHHFL